MNGLVKRYLFSGICIDRIKLWLTGLAVVVLMSVAPLAHATWWDNSFDVTIETATNGVDADMPPGPEILLGSPITWSYTVTNTGQATIRLLKVYDRAPNPNGWLRKLTQVCTIQNLNRGESQTCTLEGTATEGEYQNVGIAVAYGYRWWEWTRDRDKTHYTGVPGNPSIDLEKATQGQDADSLPGPELIVGDGVEWTFTVTNNGDVDLSDVAVTDEQAQPSVTAPVTVCEIPTLPAGLSETCTLSGIVIEGQYQNIGRVVARGFGNISVGDEDVSHYLGMVTDALVALPSAAPSSGDAPLTVTFVPNATTNNAIIRYEWDFEGDGTFDRSETVGRNQTFTYTTPGNYNAVLRVTDSTGEQATGSVLIAVNNNPPEVSVALNPSNGQVPLTVNFTATATDSDGIAQFEWDYDGDGVFDEATATGSTSYTYTTEGRFQARIRVTDNLGAETTLTIPTLEVNALPPGSPTVSLTVSPDTGNAPLTASFTATASDPDGGTITQYEWDVDGDGAYDQTTTENLYTTSYEEIGTFYPRVRVTDSDGQQAEDVARVFVEPTFSLSLDIDTVDPLIGESATVTTVLNGDSEISLVIEDRDGQQVRTLVPFTVRAAGTYQDVWNGSNESGEIAPEGDYRAILLFRMDGIVERLDLALTTGGVQSNPPRSSIPPSFSPLAGDPLEISFTLSRASEVTAFMGLFNVNTRLVTFLQREPLGRGSHQVVWNGENSDGQLIEAPPGDRFLFGIFAYTLPDNAIYVRSGVHVSRVSVSPSIYQPTQHNPDGSAALSQIQVELSRAGSARLVINNADSGARVAEFSYTGLPEGGHTITWDGRDNNNNYVAPGTYRLGVSGIAEDGYESLTVFALQRVFY